MSANEYSTVEYQRFKMYDALGFAIVSLIGLAVLLSLDSGGSIAGPMSGILGLSTAVGIYGFLDHRRYMRKLMATQKEEGGTEYEGSGSTESARQGCKG